MEPTQHEPAASGTKKRTRMSLTQKRDFVSELNEARRITPLLTTTAFLKDYNARNNTDIKEQTARDCTKLFDDPQEDGSIQYSHQKSRRTNPNLTQLVFSYFSESATIQGNEDFYFSDEEIMRTARLIHYHLTEVDPNREPNYRGPDRPIDTKWLHNFKASRTDSIIFSKEWKPSHERAATLTNTLKTQQALTPDLCQDLEVYFDEDIGGYGLRCTADLKTNQIIDIYRGNPIKPVGDRDILRDTSYVFTDDAAIPIWRDALYKPWFFTRYANEATPDPATTPPSLDGPDNCVFEVSPDRQHVYVRTLRAIPAGTILTIDYGLEYWLPLLMARVLPHQLHARLRAFHTREAKEAGKFEAIPTTSNPWVPPKSKPQPPAPSFTDMEHAVKGQPIPEPSSDEEDPDDGDYTE